MNTGETFSSSAAAIAAIIVLLVVIFLGVLFSTRSVPAALAVLGVVLLGSVLLGWAWRKQ
jgi:uncharacterized membrane protein YwaF